MAGRGIVQEAVLRTLGDGACRAIDELAAATGADRKNISSAACRLILRGWLERIETGCFRATAAGLAALERGEKITSGPNGPLAAARRPSRDTNIARYWRAMRAAGKVSIPLLIEMTTSGNGSLPDPSGAQRYVRRLAAAGYLALLPAREPGTAPTSNGHRRWLLIRDTGPEAPIVRPARREVWDPNTRESHPW